MYFVPSRHGARAALAPEEKRAKRQVGDDPDDPFASILSDIFGGGDDEPTFNEPTTPAAPRTTTVAVVVTPTPTPTPVPVILSTTPIAPTTTSRTPSTTQPFSTAPVVTSPPAPIVQPSTSSVTLTSTTSNSTNTGAADASQVISPNSALPSGVIGIIVAASVICGLIFVALVARKIFQTKRRKRRTTWARTSIIAPFEASSGIKEKALPPPPPPQQDDVQYPAYPPVAMTYAQPIPYSPAAPSSAGYPAPYPFGGTGNSNPSSNPLNPSSFTPADLAGAPPVVLQQPATALKLATASGATAATAAAATVAVAATVATATSTTGGICVVKLSFVPSLPDELSITSGEQVRVLSTYDDGWAMCEKVSSGDRGMVPQECLEDIKSSSMNTNMPGTQGSVDNAKMNRASSLKRGQGTY